MRDSLSAARALTWHRFAVMARMVLFVPVVSVAFARSFADPDPREPARTVIIALFAIATLVAAVGASGFAARLRSPAAWVAAAAFTLDLVLMMAVWRGWIASLLDYHPRWKADDADVFAVLGIAVADLAGALATSIATRRLGAVLNDAALRFATTSVQRVLLGGAAAGIAIGVLNPGAGVVVFLLGVLVLGISYVHMVGVASTALRKLPVLPVATATNRR